MTSGLSLRAQIGAAALAGIVANAPAPAQSPPEAVITSEPAAARVAPAPLDRRVTLRLSQAPLRDVIRLLELSVGVHIAPMWADSVHAEGLSPDTLVDLDARATPVVEVIESLLAQIDPTLGGGATWQIAEDGTIQIGTRANLNAFRRVVIYDIRDLLFQVKDSRDAATIDLQAALQASQGGGGATSVLREPSTASDFSPPRDAETELIDLLTQTIEPEQWECNGGSAANFRVYQRCLVVRAPGYIHRQIAGQTRLHGRAVTAP